MASDEMTRRGFLKLAPGLVAIAAFKMEAHAAPEAHAIPENIPPFEAEYSSKLAELEKSISRIYEATGIPPLPPSEYRLLFSLIAIEVNERGFAPEKTSEAVVARAHQQGLRLALEEVSVVIEAVNEIDPRLEHTRTAAAMAHGCRLFVYGKCLVAGVTLSEDEYDLIDVWIDGSPRRLEDESLLLSGV